jgi:hypothetical protein
MGVSYFHSRQTHSLVIVDTGKPRLEYMNVGEATFRGIEFEGKGLSYEEPVPRRVVPASGQRGASSGSPAAR